MHVHVSGLQALITFLEVVALFGVANLLAMRYQDKSSLAANWANLFGVS